MAVIRYAVRQVDGRIPVIAGTGSNCTEHAVELSRKAQELGADALLQVTPYYNKASQEGLVRHFTQVADHVSIPILLYNVPSRTGVTIQPETYRILSEHPNIRGTKEASGNLSLIARTAALCGQGFDIYSGNDDQTVPIMSLGGKGVVSVLANIMPKETHKMCRLYLDGDVKESRRMQLQLLEIMEALFWDVNPIPVKTALGLMGVCGDDLRLPLTPMEPEQRERLAEVMKRQGISLKKNCIIRQICYNKGSERIAVWSFMHRESKAGDCPAFIFEDVILEKHNHSKKGAYHWTRISFTMGYH